jgi:hypothetical protein
MHLRRLEIANLRTFERAIVELPEIGAAAVDAREDRLSNVTVLLGDNGAGKSTLLRAVALASLGPRLGSSGFVPFSLVRRTANEPRAIASIRGRFGLHPEQDEGDGSVEIVVELRSTDGFTDIVTRSDGADEKSALWCETLFREKTPAALVVGYGADRRVGTSKSFDPSSQYKTRALRYARVAGLFEESVTLAPLDAWLPKFRSENPGRHQQVITLLNKVIPEGAIQPEPVDGEYLFTVRGVTVPFGALSDGYRAFVGWYSDLLYQICLGAPSGFRLDETTGIVLVDEVELHLHPSWQRSVIPLVARALPRLQFIFSTHSPLVVGSLHRDNIFVLSDPGGESRRTELSRPASETFGLGVEQLLTSESFGLKTTRNDAFASRLRAAGERAQDGDDEAALQFVRMLTLGAAAGESSPEPAEKPDPPSAKKSAAKKSAAKKPAAKMARKS